ncbi:peptidoglycan-binding protein [uncultured Marinobacter sp.]|uniref:peptidoglycan-binding domain-containing protein n=1 Tax=uncultured Marinobacter sp. TaxID=187379 RepID=UPI00262E79FA|nr:peptidoglycan-binding protein [uncultured Marinobacter sp.]
MMNSLIRCVSTAFVIALLSLGMTSANAGLFDDLAESADQLRQTAEDLSQLGKNRDTEPDPKPNPEYKAEESGKIKPPSVNPENGSLPANDYNNSPSHVLTAQRMLNQLGYNVGRADGVYGRNTESGIRAFQADKGLPVHGNVTARLLGELSQESQQASSRLSSTSQATQRVKSAEEGTRTNPQNERARISTKGFPPELVFDRPTSGKSCIELHSNCRGTTLEKQKKGEININQAVNWDNICTQQLQECFAFENSNETSESPTLISRHIMEMIDQCRYGSSTSRRFDCDCIEQEYKNIHSGKPNNQEYNDYNAALAQCVDPRKTYNYAYESCISSADLILKQQTGNKSSKKDFCECTAVEYRAGLLAAANVPSANVGDSQFNRRLLTSSFDKCL